MTPLSRVKPRAWTRLGGDIPRAYLLKWQRTIDTLVSLRPGAIVCVSAVEAGSRLRVMVTSGDGSPVVGTTRPVDSPDLAVLVNGRQLLIGDPPAPDGGPMAASLSAVPLLWPDRGIYGVLTVVEGSGEPFTAPWLDLIQQMRLVIESDLRTIHYVRQVDATKEQLEGHLQQRNEELERVNVRLAAQLKQSRQLSDILRRLATSGDGEYGEAYFRHLVQQLAELFGAEHAFVAVLSDEIPGTASTLAAFSNGRVIDNFGYDVDASPCRQLLQHRSLLLRGGVGREYPCGYGGALPAESYVGVRLCDSTDEVIGTLVLMGSTDLPDSQLVLQLMELMATRTSTEILRMRAEQHLRRISELDELTGLLNRSSFLARLGEALERRADHGSESAVLFIDLDNFKTINDTLGHDVGDELLTMVGHRIRRCFEATSVVARLGGDEFAALVRVHDEARLRALCERIVSRFNTPFLCRDQELFLSVSIGVSQSPQDGVDTRALLRKADIAMYKAKDRGKNQGQIYSQDLRDELDDDLRMVTRLRRAVIERQFQVFFQPKVDTCTREVIGAEALLRWSDPEIGQVSPLTFIPLAQRSGIIDGLGDLVVTMVAEHIREWSAAGLRVPNIAVNVSPSQLRDNRFGVRLTQLTRSYCLDPSLLTIELTEDALMLHSGAGLSTLDDLADRGFRISIDDFGTGYSSLSYLRSMPIDEVKIDRSFIRGIAERSDDRAIAAAILSLARTLGLDVVAEGVELEAQFQVLKELSCRTAQGFLFHHPMPEPAFRRLLDPA